MNTDKDIDLEEIMQGFYGNIEQLTIENNDFRRVLYTGKHAQLVLMSLLPGEEIGSEVHPDHDQFLRFEAGEGTVAVDDTLYDVKDGDAVVVPAGARHNVVNASATEDLKLYTLYGPAHHQDGLVHPTRDDAEVNDKDFDGTTTE